MRAVGRRTLLRYTASAIAVVSLVRCAPTAPRTPQRIGWLSVFLDADADKEQLDPFRERLRELGHAEGRDLDLVLRFTGQRPERTEALIGELRALPVRVIVGHGTAVDAKPFLSGMPFVMAIGFDPVENGVAQSLARPGGSITGVAGSTTALISKRLELLKEVAPRTSLVGLLRNAFSPDAFNARVIEQARVAAERFGMRVTPIDLDTRRPDASGAIEDAFARAAAAGNDGIVAVFQFARIRDNRELAAELTARYRLPAIYAESSPVEGGGLASLGADQREHVRRAAGYVDKILKGANPAELPIEIPEQVEIALNLTAAKQLGLDLAPSVLARANHVFK